MKEILLAFPLALALAACNAIEKQESHYRDHAAAVGAGEVERGWLPRYVPASASDIRMRHDLDTSETWIEFRFAAADRPALGATCTGVIPRAVPLPEPVAWWPLALRAAGGPDQQYLFEYYRCTESPGNLRIITYLAVHKMSEQAWVWRTSR